MPPATTVREAVDTTHESVPTGRGEPRAATDALPPPSLPDPPPAPVPRPLAVEVPYVWTTGKKVVAVVAILFAVGLVTASVVRVPYYRIAPGTARAAGDVIAVDGSPTYDASGEVLFTTVSIGRETALRALYDWLDPDVDVLSAEQYLGGRSRDETREQNLALMAASKDTATYVALTRLGFDVGIDNGGVVVARIGDDVPAAGLLEIGDLVVAADGVPTPLPDALRAHLATKRPGDTVVLSLQRGEEAAPAEVTVPLVAADDGRAIIGIAPAASASTTFRFPVDVQISSGSIGGPSAGLAFTLALLDELSPGELTGGRRIAATGSIDVDGNVGLIGGVRQKAIAVAEAGAEVFFVPPSEVDRARAGAAGTDLEVIGVATLEDALAALAARGGDPLPAAA
jgi:PDZ domain-containing protein